MRVGLALAIMMAMAVGFISEGKPEFIRSLVMNPRGKPRAARSASSASKIILPLHSQAKLCLDTPIPGAWVIESPHVVFFFRVNIARWSQKPHGRTTAQSPRLGDP